MNTTRICWLVAASVTCSVSVANAEGGFKNGLSIRAFGHNALTLNKTNVDYLVGHPLTQAMFDAGPVHDALADPNARAVMTEIVRCALKPTALPLTYTGGGIQASFAGEVGLCNDASHMAGDWTTDSTASPTCRQIVTGCVAARVNALGESVPISIQGRDSVPPPALSVTTETTYRFPNTGDPATGQTIASFLPCTPAGSCGQWVAGSVGTCTGGDPVTLTETGTCNILLQACDGVHGCVVPAMTDPVNAIPRQTRLGWISPTNSCVATFQCPRSGTYSTMIRVPPSGIRPTIRASSGVYPAAEVDVFHVREGAFYGDMFDSAGLTIRTCSWNGTVTVCQGVPGCDPSGAPPGTQCSEPNRVPYNKVYACFASGIANDHNNEGAVYFNDRVCAGDEQCFTHKPDRCYYKDATDNATKGSHCTWDTQTFGTCQPASSTDHTPYPVITTYLNAPCDLIRGTTCTEIWPTLSETGFRAETDRDDVELGDDDGGCSVGRTRSGLVTFLLAGIALVIARRSRRRA